MRFIKFLFTAAFLLRQSKEDEFARLRVLGLFRKIEKESNLRSKS